MSLGQRGSFAIHGVPEAARLFFGKDVTNVSLSRGRDHRRRDPVAVALSPFNNPDRAKERRNVVLQAMADAGFISAEPPSAPSREPLQIVRARARRRSAVLRRLHRPGAAGASTARRPAPIDVYTTLDLHMQRLAQDARARRADARRRAAREAQAGSERRRR